MALPTSMSRNFFPVTKSGVVLGIVNSTDPLDDLELWRSTQFASTASSLWSVTRYPPTTTPTYQIPVLLPVTTRYQYFKARSQKLGFSPSTFTPIVRAKPVIFAQHPTSPNVPTNRNKALELPTPIFMNAAETMKVGAPSQVSPTTYITKTLRVPYTEMVPETTAQSYTYGSTSFLRPASTAAIEMWMSNVFPKGITLTDVKVRWFRTSSTAVILRAKLFRVSDTSTANALASLESQQPLTGSTGWHNSNASLSQAVGDEIYSLQVILIPGAVATNARFMFAEFTYRMPRYDKAY